VPAAGVVDIPVTGWDGSCPAGDRELALRTLEGGGVLHAPRLGFPLREAEARLLTPALAAHSKSVSYDPSRDELRGSSAGAADQVLLRAMMRRFSDSSRTLLRHLLPQYAGGLAPGRTSFRPVAIGERPGSWRKDDRRLHVDAFPSTPVQGRRILRVFCNVNPHRQPRSWRLGEPFEDVARRFLPILSRPAWGSGQLLHALGITRSRRSPYDHLMLQLHDAMKADLAYQAEAVQRPHEFPPGSTWVVFTDQVTHAATKGQYLLEQTCYLPVSAMLDPSRSPLRILERATGLTLT
jgi:hypothetical protein